MPYGLTSWGLEKAAMEATYYQEYIISHPVWVTGWPWLHLSALLHFWISVSLNRRLKIILCFPCFTGQFKEHRVTCKVGQTRLKRCFTHRIHHHSILTTVKLHHAQTSFTGKVGKHYFEFSVMSPNWVATGSFSPNGSFLVIRVCPLSPLYGTHRNGVIFSSCSEH